MSLNVLNVTNERVELDNSLTFGGFHWNNPREVYVRFAIGFTTDDGEKYAGILRDVL